jgi:hypothetical protein
MMTREQYANWWLAWPDVPAETTELLSTLVDHVTALQDRIDRLPGELNCCCAYDDPRDVCMTHAGRVIA